MHRALPFALLLAGCIDGPPGPIGPGGKANRFSVEDKDRSGIDFEDVRAGVAPLAASVVTFTLEGDLESNPDRTLGLEIDLDLDRLDEGPLPLDLDVAQTSTYLSSGPELTWTNMPLRRQDDAIRGLRFFDICPGCVVGSGSQRFDGRFRLIGLDGARVEAYADIDFAGSTPAEPGLQRNLEIRAFIDLGLP